jgi:hypothetical protein
MSTVLERKVSAAAAAAARNQTTTGRSSSPEKFSMPINLPAHICVYRVSQFKHRLDLTFTNSGVYIQQIKTEVIFLAFVIYTGIILQII